MPYLTFIIATLPFVLVVHRMIILRRRRNITPINREQARTASPEPTSNSRTANPHSIEPSAQPHSPKPEMGNAAPERIYDPPSGEWAEPAHYKSRTIEEFVPGEVMRTYLGSLDDEANGWVLDFSLSEDPTPSVARVEQWMDRPVTLALRGLYGCTSVVILTSWGAWISHCKCHSSY
ncbi:hypothetical protein P280DRAFT_334453 [Massarina eburnea CBS 473.64]|uniref:Uncharacterized protein n=1 Tax=Massarina eburnea CBS 473.64 TaxID=1395130 RepID=A0A6A6S1M5_9PLEO|nr:hypothetical protein P280DRAFT_334453 [Massarina eburnea CBS 473.64]